MTFRYSRGKSILFVFWSKSYDRRVFILSNAPTTAKYNRWCNSIQIIAKMRWPQNHHLFEVLRCEIYWWIYRIVFINVHNILPRKMLLRVRKFRGKKVLQGWKIANSTFAFFFWIILKFLTQLQKTIEICKYKLDFSQIFDFIFLPGRNFRKTLRDESTAPFSSTYTILIDMRKFESKW